MMLRDSEMSEWEILNSLHARYGFTPSLAEFRRTSNLLVKRGFAELGQGENGASLRVTEDGLKLLLRLQQEYSAMVACAYPRRRSVLSP